MTEDESAADRAEAMISALLLGNLDGGLEVPTEDVRLARAFGDIGTAAWISSMWDLLDVWAREHPDAAHGPKWDVMRGTLRSLYALSLNSVLETSEHVGEVEWFGERNGRLIPTMTAGLTELAVAGAASGLLDEATEWFEVSEQTYASPLHAVLALLEGGE